MDSERLKTFPGKRLTWNLRRNIASSPCQKSSFHICELTRSRVTFLRAVETYAEPIQSFKINLVKFSEAELTLVSSTGHTELLENKLSQIHSGLCQNVRNCYQVCRDNKYISK